MFRQKLAAAAAAANAKKVDLILNGGHDDGTNANDDDEIYCIAQSGVSYVNGSSCDKAQRSYQQQLNRKNNISFY